MKYYQSQKGFSVVEALLVILFIAILGFLGYKFYEYQQDQDSNNVPMQSAGQTDDGTEINSEEDLDKADKTLDETDVDNENNADSKELDSKLETF